LLGISLERAKLVLIGRATQELSDEADKMLKNLSLNHPDPEEEVNPPASS